MPSNLTWTAEGWERLRCPPKMRRQTATTSRFAHLNRDTVHRLLRRIGVTRETSYPSERYSAFSRHCDCYVTLHLKGERHLYGWPEVWPSRPDEGHFRIAEAEWLVENERIPATGVAAILIPADQVELVEFVREAHDEPEE